MPEQTDLTKPAISKMETVNQIRIDGVMTLPPSLDIHDVTFFMNTLPAKWEGNISPINPDGESFMVEVRRDEWQKMKETIDNQAKMIDHYRERQSLQKTSGEMPGYRRKIVDNDTIL
jgi:hypothetical protein